MAGEIETPEVETPEVPEVPTPEERKHPLEPGGVRFEDVVREKNELKAEAAALRAQLARQQEAPKEPPAPKPQFYTAEQLQQAVDAGRISPAQMADQLAWQRAEQARLQTVNDLDLRQKRASATTEVNQYLDRIPALADPSSKEFLKASRIASEIAEEMGWDVRDPRVQRQALRQAFGTLDRLADATKTREYAREHADTTVETRGGGGRVPPKADPFKDVPQPLKDHWDRLGYSVEQRKAELPYVNLDRWKRRHG